MTETTKRSRLVLCAVPALLLAGCVPQQSVQTEPVVISSSRPPQRSYLDAGPVPATGGGPNYVRDSLSPGPRQTDSFGNGVLPQLR